jgi:arylsulfatase A-like enzyme
VRGPGVPVGESCSSLVLNNDLAPTFANLAGVIAPDFVDGRSLKPLLTSDLTQPQNWRSQFLIQHKYVPSEEESEIPIPSYRALRSNEYLYVEYESTERELYNLPSDLYQLKNIATEVDQGLVESLAAQLTELSTCKGISCQVIEDRPSVTLKSPAVK